MNYKLMMWEHWHYCFGLAGEGQADIIQTYLERKRGRAVTVGCGPNGNKIARLAQYCESLLAIDHELKAVVLAKGSGIATTLNFLVADAHHLPLSDNCADYVIALGLFAYITDPRCVLTEFSRVCRPGGYVLFTNSVSRSKRKHQVAGTDASLVFVEEAEGYCPAASGDKKARYLLVFRKPARAEPRHRLPRTRAIEPPASANQVRAGATRCCSVRRGLPRCESWRGIPRRYQ